MVCAENEMRLFCQNQEWPILELHVRSENQKSNLSFFIFLTFEFLCFFFC